ncbi:MAG TPA: tetratricopeptide repeat protein [Candidatus Solibacter sp.]|jgi:hypothetical protein
MTKRIGGPAAVLAILTCGLLLRSQDKTDPVQELRTQLRRLEARVQELERRQLPVALQERYRARWAQDEQRFTRAQMAEIEQRYQSVQGNWGTPEAIGTLNGLISKFPEADRAGCALLYLGQMTQGKQREEYLKEAIAKHSDAMYGDMVQVGAFARFLLATDYLQSGRTAEAAELFAAIRSQYPDAVDHSGTHLSALIPK